MPSIKRNADTIPVPCEGLGNVDQIDQQREMEFRVEGHAIIREQLDYCWDTIYGERRLHFDCSPLLLFDCAVGLGEFLESLEGDGRFRCYGIDIDYRCVESARTHADCAAIMQGDALGLDASPHMEGKSPSGTYDIVVATALLEHVANPDELLRGIHRISNRWALIMTPNALRPAKVWDAIRGRVRWERKGHLQAWDYHLFKQQLEYHGFKVHRIDVRFVDFPWGHKRFPRLVRWLSYGPLKRWFPMLGSEMFALCEKVSPR